MVILNRVSKSISRKGIFGQRAKLTNILNDISFQINDYDSIALLGENGSGKTTLLKIISGNTTASSGEIVLQNHVKCNILGANENSFFQRISVLDNLRFFYTDSPKNLLEKAGWALSKLGIEEKMHQIYATLSSGEKKKVAIARALMRKTDILLLDEVTSFLDLKSKYELINTLKELLRLKELKSIIFVTHNLDEAEALSNRVIMLRKGCLHFDIKSDEIDFSANFMEKYQ